jgi:hypothetical protein
MEGHFVRSVLGSVEPRYIGGGVLPWQSTPYTSKLTVGSNNHETNQ